MIVININCCIQADSFFILLENKLGGGIHFYTTFSTKLSIGQGPFIYSVAGQIHNSTLTITVQSQFSNQLYYIYRD